MYKVLSAIRCSGKVYQPGEAFTGELEEAELKELVKAGVLATEKSAPAAKKEAKKPTAKKEAEGEQETTPQPVATNLGKTKLMEIAKEEGVALEETMTPEEMRLAINKARGVK